MPQSPVELITERILDLEQQLAEHRKALDAINSSSRPDSEEERRAPEDLAKKLEFVNMPATEAIEKLLKREARPLEPAYIVEKIMQGGGGINKKRAHHNIRIAMENGLHTERFLLSGASMKKKPLAAIQEAVARNEGAVSKNISYTEKRGRKSN